MDFEYINLYFDIVGEKGILGVLKKYFVYYEKEILYYLSLNYKEREQYINENKNIFKYDTSSNKALYFDSIKIAVDLYRNICHFKDFDMKINDCSGKQELELINDFIRTYNSSNVYDLIKYSLKNKYNDLVKTEINNDINNEQYLNGYLRHFKTICNIDFSYDTSSYIKNYRIEIFSQIIDGLINDNLFKIFIENEKYVDIVIDYCDKFMKKDKFLSENFEDIKNSILNINMRVKEFKEKSTDCENNDNLNVNYQYINLVANAEDIINKLVNGNYSSIKQFCENENIDSYSFKKFVWYLRDYNKCLYDKYKVYRNKLQKNRYKSLVVYTKNVLDVIENGIVLKDGTVRDFDNLDYVLMCNMDICTFKRIIESNAELIKLKGTKYKNFYNKYLKRNKLIINLDVLKREKKIIANHEVTDEEKEEVVDFFKNNGIYLEEGLLSIALRKKVKGEIDFSNYECNNIFKEMMIENEFEDVNLDGIQKIYLKK